jgi:ABC-type antimicrobial peptide transport system permease subunit
MHGLQGGFRVQDPDNVCRPTDAASNNIPRPGVGTTLQARSLRPPGLVDGPNPFPALAALFLTLAGMVFALACLNVANLSLVRSIGRQRKMAVRAALGGSRIRLILRLLSETLLLTLSGAAAGLVAGSFALHAVS